MALQRAHPGARVLATDLDPGAVRCSRANGVDSYQGDLFSPLPGDILGAVDLVVGVAPYVPTRISFCFHGTPWSSRTPRTTTGEQMALMSYAASWSLPRPSWSRAATLLLEVGGEQAELLETDLRRAGFTDVDRWYDDDGDLRGIEATLGHRRDVSGHAPREDQQVG